MTLRQTVNPNYGIGATRGLCLQYVDDAISAPNRTYSAQLAYESAKTRGWVRANAEMPRGLWSILFWSIPMVMHGMKKVVSFLKAFLRIMPKIQKISLCLMEDIKDVPL